MEGALAAIDQALEIDNTSSKPLLAKAEILIQEGFAQENEARIAEGAAIVERAALGFDIDTPADLAELHDMCAARLKS